MISVDCYQIPPEMNSGQAFYTPPQKTKYDLITKALQYLVAIIVENFPFNEMILGGSL